MNKIYRLVWNARIGAWVVAAENARSRGKSSKSTARLLLAAGLITPAIALAQVVPATTVLPIPGRTNAYIAPNGVPVVNIDTANAQGVSHNRFTRFDVEANGLVLNNGNNAVAARQSQLAGQVVSNVNLVQEARIMLTLTRN